MVSWEKVVAEGNFKGQQRDFVAHCFCLVTFLLKFHSPVSVRKVAAKIITALKAMTWPYAKCHFPSPSPHRLARVQCSLCALLVSIAKSCVLEVCCRPPPMSSLATLTSTLPCGALRYFVYVLFIPKNARFVRNLPQMLNSLGGGDEREWGRGGVPSVDCTHFMALGF